jgi:hypothetical protein
LGHILEGGPADIEHPRFIQRFLDAGLPGDAYVEYRERMLKLIAP